MLHADQQFKRLDTLITCLLDLSKATTGSFSINLEAVSFSDTVRTSAEQTSGEIRSSGETLNFIIEHFILGNCDSMRLSQIVVNLVTNAAKHAPGSTVEVSLADTI